MNGSTTGSPTIQTEGLQGATATALKSIMSDLEDIKVQQAGALERVGGRSRKDKYKYLDDKTLYSSE